MSLTNAERDPYINFKMYNLYRQTARGIFLISHCRFSCTCGRVESTGSDLSRLKFWVQPGQVGTFLQEANFPTANLEFPIRLLQVFLTKRKPDKVGETYTHRHNCLAFS